MVNPKKYKDNYDAEKQEAANSGFQMPPSGIYDIVNVAVQKMIVGKNHTEKRRIRAHILGVVELENGGDADGLVGSSFPFDLWWNMEKEANARRLCHLAAACGNADEFDENDDSSLVAAITGVPYRMKLNVREREHKGKTLKDADPVYTTHLPKAKRQGYMKDPDFAKLVGAPEDRVLEAKDYSSQDYGGGGGGGKKGEETEDPFNDEDLPF